LNLNKTIVFNSAFVCQDYPGAPSWLYLDLIYRPSDNRIEKKRINSNTVLMDISLLYGENNWEGIVMIASRGG
jgi:hypothetical protein